MEERRKRLIDRLWSTRTLPRLTGKVEEEGELVSKPVMNESSGNVWQTGSVWRFEDEEVSRTVETFLNAKASKRRRLNTNLSTLDSRRLFIKTKFIGTFNDLNYRVRKSKSGTKSSNFVRK